MTALVQDRHVADRLRAERKANGTDRWDEVWDGVYILMPLPNSEHQGIVTRLAGILDLQAGLPVGGRVFAGINVSDREEDWTRNYRCPDVAVFLPDTRAVDHGTFWLGGPDVAVKVVSTNDRSHEKLDFYAGVGTRELLLIDRDPWGLELYREGRERMELAGRSTLADPAEVRSEVLPLSFRVVAADPRPRIEVARHDGGGRWSV